MKKYLCLLLIAFVVSCATTEQMSTIWAGGDALLETDTKPNQLFIDKKIGSVSVMPFDAKSVRTYRGKIIDYVDLGNNFTDDLIKKFYTVGKVKVTVGEYMDEVLVEDVVEKQVGDINTKRSQITRSVKYKAAPFRKVDALLTGRILKFNAEKPFEKSFIEIYLKLTDTYDGTVYWITRMRGNYGNVIDTLAGSISSGEYIETRQKLGNAGEAGN